MEMPRLLLSCLQKKEQACVHPSVYVSDLQWDVKWERGGQTGALAMAGGDNLQGICVIRFSNMESASEQESGLILSAEPATPGK